MKIGINKQDCPVGTRDAVHAPCVYTVAYGPIKPGDGVRFLDDSFKSAERCKESERHGIADPFVNKIAAGEPFLVLLRPDSTANLRHYYDVTIPGIPAAYVEEKFISYNDDNCRGCY